ncbi:protein MCM10 homolog [Gigantopelta aegis]|uniref:protein MCM10 homolog n=1 Tax=Gigantopelta aegis TaxID=1735272 RepID=UPI001B88D934|nr:protein MCM10 homolog [Gigantopelta aegis]XP_041348946.1 protein MCM10 homolog [Gigantopelta aegis]
MSDDCSLEELTAFLDDSSLDEAPSDTQDSTRLDGAPEELGGAGQKESSQNNQPTCTVEKSLSATSTSIDHSEDRIQTPMLSPPVMEGPSKEDIQAELLAMQKRMEDLKKLLTQQNSDSFERTNSQRSMQPSSTTSSQCSRTMTNTGSSDLTKLKPTTRVLPSSAERSNQCSSLKNKFSSPSHSKPTSSRSKSDDVLNSEQLAPELFDPWEEVDEKIPVDNQRLKTAQTKTPTTKSDLKISPTLFSLESADVVKAKVTRVAPTVHPNDRAGCLEAGHNDNDDAPTGKQLEKDLFGDSDSDWDDFDGEEKATLTGEGREIKKLIKSGSRPRTSHISSEHTAIQAERPTWKSKPKASSQQVSSSMSNAKKNISDPDEKFITDAFTGIRIVKPLVSSTELARKMQDRKLIRISRLHLKIKTPDVQGNWVTIGVIVHKTDPKTSSNGKVYTIWKMSDLEDCDHVVSFFLFGQVYKDHWKTNLGSVVGLLNPSIMDSADKAVSDVAFTINNPHQLLLLGQSKDLGWCGGKTRKGNPCSNFISKKFGDFCSYHVQSAYRKASAKRSELQGSFTGAAPKSFEQKLKKTGSHFMYGGQTFLSSSVNPRKKPQDQVTIKKLQFKQHSIEDGKKVTTMSLHELKASDSVTLPNKPGSEEEDKFIDLISTPSIGSMNLVKHLIKQEKTANVQNEKVVLKSVTPKELLHQYQTELKEKRKNQQLQNECATKSSQASSAPVLGKGFYPGSDIFLDSCPKTIVKAANKSAELSRRKAVAKVIANGGIAKEDPNAVKKKVSAEHIKKRVRKNIDDKPTDVQSEEPPAKRSRLLGNVDLNSEEVKKLMKARSSHRGALAEVEAEKEEKYFNELEKKEKMEEKMQSITELKTTVFTCKQCRYTAFSAGDTCKKEHHNVVRHSAMKRFFKCTHCKTRCIAITRYPIHPCKKCHGNKFERTSMVKEKTGPKLECETLCLRGDEIKFLNSLQENVFL